MNQFPTDWLRLREPFDHAARSTALVETLLGILPASRPLRILELGAGLGSGMRFLAPLLPTPQHWTMIDHDPALLASVGPPPTNSITLETLEFDLRELDKLDFSADLVSTQALLDLVSGDWLESLVNLLADQKPSASCRIDGRRADPMVPGRPKGCGNPAGLPRTSDQRPRLRPVGRHASCPGTGTTALCPKLHDHSKTSRLVHCTGLHSDADATGRWHGRGRNGSLRQHHDHQDSD